MSSPSSSRISVVNKTAFPLNIAISLVAPFEHINALEPGDAWIANSPSFFPFPLLDDDSLRIPRRAMRALAPLLLVRHPKWLNRFPRVSIDVRFDHEHNRYSESEAFHLWASFSLRWLGLVSLALASGLLVASQLLGTFSLHSAKGIPLICLILGIIGSACLIKAFYERRRANATNAEPHLSKGQILFASVSERTLSPITPPSINPVPSPTTPPRSQRNLAVIWLRGRFALWDLDLDQEIIAQFNGRR